MPEIDSKEDVFVRITESTDLRKEILESAKISTNILRNCENLTSIYNKKKKESFKLNLVLSEVKSLVNTMQFKEVSSDHETQKQEKIIVPKKDFKQKDKLSMDLEEIEKKLNSLKF